MKSSGFLALALFLSPTLALAQQPPAGPPPDAAGSAAAAHSLDPQRFAAMQQLHQQMRQLHQQSRSQMLAALTPQHRTMIANIAGGLTVANNPDPAAAARQIDALLSPAEKQSVLNIHTTTQASMRNMMQSQRAQFEASMSTEQRAKMQERDAQRQSAEQAHPRVSDPGAIVLHMLGHFGGPGEGIHRPSPM